MKRGRTRRYHGRPTWFLAGVAFVATLAASAAQTGPGRKFATIELPVRVLDGTRFVDDLTLQDFSISENGILLMPESLYLFKGQTIVRREEGVVAPPDMSRTFYLMFQTVDWDSKLAEAIDHLFSAILVRGDAMTLITPMKPYALHKDALATKAPAEMSKAMRDLLRQDIQRGGGQYRTITRDLVRLSRSIGGVRAGVSNDIDEEADSESSAGFGLEQQFDHYRNALMTMESLRLVDEKKLLAFADLLRSTPGQKIVFLFYAREYRPEIAPNAVQRLMSLYQDNPTILGNLMDLFQLYKRETKFNAELVKKAFADAGIVFHFIFMEKKTQRISGAHMRELSEDVFPGFREIAAATGGITDVSQNPATSFARAAAASAEFYLLSYVPPSSPAKGFRSIQVKVIRPDAESANYSVTNRIGYYAR